ncbi:MAG TPA: sigma-70 family RNA polymerase sigma factor [Gemmataceae bacterium]|nr:sigma-70 family RNA polymerase sigma factor [Gemmataceae bacterium]
MATGQMGGVLGRLCGVVLRRESGDLTNAQLLECFLASRDGAAFEALVRRYGPMVLGVCRRLLDVHDAEDAFQATFLVLVRKAASVVPRERVGHWLWGVAYRTALKARAAAARRRSREKQARTLPEAEAPGEDTRGDLRPLLDEELNRLPEKYRVPVVLCYLAGQGKTAVAQQLGLPEGTVSSRLVRARELLRQRLSRRALILSGGALASALSSSGAPAAVPAPLISSTLTIATQRAATGTVIPPAVAVLAEGVLHAMFLTRFKVAAALLLAVGLLGTVAGAFTHRVLAEPPRDRVVTVKATPEAVVPAQVEPEKKDKKGTKDPAKPQPKPDLTGQISAVSSDFRTITLSLPPRVKGDPPTSIDIKLTDKTKLSYFGVDSNGENLTVGYVAQVWLVEGSQDTAAGVRLGRKDADGGKGPDLIGQIVAVSRDGKTITVEVQPKEKGEKPTKVEIKLTKKTKFSYFGVDQTGETPTVGYVVLVWFLEGSKDTAAGLRLGLKN